MERSNLSANPSPNSNPQLVELLSYVGRGLVRRANNNDLDVHKTSCKARGNGVICDLALKKGVEMGLIRVKTALKCP